MWVDFEAPRITTPNFKFLKELEKNNNLGY